MKCWECKKKISSAIRVCYIECHKEAGLSKEKFRDVCKECYPKLKFNSCHFVEVEKITGKQIKGKPREPGYKKNKNPFLKPGGGLDLIEKFPAYKKKKITKERRGKIK